MTTGHSVVGLERPARLAIWPLAITFAFLSLMIATGNPSASFGGASLLGSSAELAAGLSMITCGLVVGSRPSGRRIGALMVAAGFAWFLVEWANPGSKFAPAFTAGLVAYALGPPFVAHVALAYPTGRLGGRVERVALVIAYLSAGILLGLGPSVFFDPDKQGCIECPANLLLVHGDAGVFDFFNRWGVRVGLASSLLLVALMAWRFIRATAPMRRVAGPVLLAGGVFGLLVARDFGHSLSRGFLSNDQVDYNLWLGESAALIGLALAVALGVWRARRTRSSVARLVVELGESPPPGGLRELLAHALGDSTLEVAYPLEGRRHVDAQGRSVELRAGHGRAVTPVLRDGRPIARLVHDSRLLEDPGFVEEVAAASRLAIENERLRAEVRAQLRNLRASRVRIVETGDAERRRLERDLHDGAQQRLVSLSLALRMARSRLDAHDDRWLNVRMDEAEMELRGALEELRELAHGIHPVVLTDEGLAAALEALAESASIPIEIAKVPEDRLAPSVETAAYLVVVEASKRAARAGATGLAVAVRLLQGRLVIDLSDDGGGATNSHDANSFRDLVDRIGALDGQLSVERAPMIGMRVHAEIPCE